MGGVHCGHRRRGLRVADATQRRRADARPDEDCARHPANVGQPAYKRCIYWLHTHTPDGFIHVEAPLDRSFTLGDFFAVWGQPLTKTTAASAHTAKGESQQVWVNGKAFTGDPRSIPLTAHADIVIQVGPPHAKPAAFTAWGGL